MKYSFYGESFVKWVKKQVKWKNVNWKRKSQGNNQKHLCKVRANLVYVFNLLQFKNVSLSVSVQQQNSLFIVKCTSFRMSPQGAEKLIM